MLAASFWKFFQKNLKKFIQKKPSTSFKDILGYLLADFRVCHYIGSFLYTPRKL